MVLVSYPTNLSWLLLNLNMCVCAYVPVYINYIHADDIMYSVLKYLNFVYSVSGSKDGFSHMIIRLFRKSTEMTLKWAAERNWRRLGANWHQMRREAMRSLNSHEKHQSTLVSLLIHQAMSHFSHYRLVFWPHKRHGMWPVEPVWGRNSQELPKTKLINVHFLC